MNIHFFNSLSSSLVDIKDQFLRNFTTPKQRQVTAIALIALACVAAAFLIRYCLKRNAKKDENDIEAQKGKAEVNAQDKKKIKQDEKKIKQDEKRANKANKAKQAAEERLKTQGQNKEKLLANKKEDSKTQEEKDAELAQKLAREDIEDSKTQEEKDAELAQKLAQEDAQETDADIALRLSLEESKADPKKAIESDEEVARKLQQALSAADSERASKELIDKITEQDLKEAEKAADKKDDNAKPAPVSVPAKATPKGTPVPVPAKATPAPTKVAPVPAKATPAPTKVAPVPAKATPAPTKVAPVPAKATPAPTKVAPVPAKATPAPTKVAPVPAKATPAPTKVAPVPAKAVSKGAPAPVSDGGAQKFYDIDPNGLRPVHDVKKVDVAAPTPEPQNETEEEKEAAKKKAQDEARKKIYEAKQAELNKKPAESQLKVTPNATPIPKAVNADDEEIEKESKGEGDDLGTGAGDAGVAGEEKESLKAENPSDENDDFIEPEAEASPHSDPIDISPKVPVKLEKGEDKVAAHLRIIFTENNPVLLSSNIRDYFAAGGTIPPFLEQLSINNQVSYLNCLWEVLSSYQNAKKVPEAFNQETITKCLKKHAQLVGCNTLEELLEHAIKEKSGLLINILLQQGLDLNTRVESSGNTYLITAIRGQHYPIAELLIQKGALVDQAGKDGTTPIMAAVEVGHLDSVKGLIAKRVNVNPAVQPGSPTPLELALHKNHVQIAEALINAGAKVDRQSPYEGNTALHLAITNGLSTRVIYALIQNTNEAALNAANNNGETALLLAIRKNDQILVRDLLDKGAKVVDGLLHSALSPLNNAVIKPGIIDSLLKKGANPNYRDPTTNKIPLELVKNNQIIKTLLLNHGADLKLPFSDRSNIVEAPAPEIKKEIAAEKVEKSDDASKVGEKEIEAKKAELPIEKVELKPAEDILVEIWNAKDIKAATPHIQAYIEAKGTVEGFIEALKTANNEPNSLLKRFEIFCKKYQETYPTEEISVEEMKKGLEACAHSLKSNLIDLLEVVTNQGDAWAVGQICAQDLDVNAHATKSGNTALITAIKSKVAHGERWVVIDLLMKSGKADINKTARDGMTPLMTAVVKGDSEDIRRLFLTGADVNQAVDQESEIRTPLEYALDKKQWEVAKLLIGAGAKSERQMSNQGSALHLAIINGLPQDAIIKLAENGAKFELANKEGKTVINLICELKHVRLLPQLAKYIALDAAIKSNFPLLVTEVLKVKQKAEPSDLWLALQCSQVGRASDRTDVIIEKLIEIGGLDLDSRDSDSGKTLRELAIEKAVASKNLKVRKFLEDYKKSAIAE